MWDGWRVRVMVCMVGRTRKTRLWRLVSEPRRFRLLLLRIIGSALMRLVFHRVQRLRLTVLRMIRRFWLMERWLCRVWIRFMLLRWRVCLIRFRWRLLCIISGRLTMVRRRRHSSRMRLRVRLGHGRGIWRLRRTYTCRVSHCYATANLIMLTGNGSELLRVL